MRRRTRESCHCGLTELLCYRWVRVRGTHPSPAHEDMANVAWGLAKLGLLHEQLLEVLSRDFVARANECQARPHGGMAK